MRWIDRGPEPPTVSGYAQQFTSGWVNYFENQIGGRPTDSYWRDYRADLGARSGNICWYCERQCDAETYIVVLLPTVDHFQPISKFPRLAYAWSNWVFSCDRCNQNKGDYWPETGFIDPSDPVVAERPEQYFDFDAGDIVPKNGLSDVARRKALNTIDRLQLNNLLLKKSREEKLDQFLKEIKSRPAAEQGAFVVARLEQPGEFAGVIRMFAEYLSRQGGIRR